MEINPDQSIGKDGLERPDLTGKKEKLLHEEEKILLIFASVGATLNMLISILSVAFIVFFP